MSCFNIIRVVKVKAAARNSEVLPNGKAEMVKLSFGNYFISETAETAETYPKL